MPPHIAGRARLLGDDVNTDYIITSKRKRDTLDEQILKRYLFETIDPAFAASVQPGDVLVAGRNFGCGSAMEIAATVILAAGVRAVLAKSFARSFYRNAINNGLLPIECDTNGVAEGDRIVVMLDHAVLTAENETRGETLVRVEVPALVDEILSAGGLVEHVRRRRG
ncbi:MAG TPA: 3-isopropylmalate dehydratase [Gemmatimonadaceae bacterium]|nr:3-isopropylmalate dehydratase [Gemmatimonadaceae bacterium]